MDLHLVQSVASQPQSEEMWANAHGLRIVEIGFVDQFAVGVKADAADPAIAPNNTASLLVDGCDDIEEGIFVGGKVLTNLEFGLDGFLE